MRTPTIDFVSLVEGIENRNRNPTGATAFQVTMVRLIAFATTAASCLTLPGCATYAPASGLIVSNVTVISAERAQPMEHAYVRIRDGRIAQLSGHPLRGETTIDGTGRYLIPGLIDSHVHTGRVNGMNPQQEAAHPDIAAAAREQIPRSYLYFGFTTLIDLDGNSESIAKWKAYETRPDIYFCGGAPVVDGYPTNWDPKPQRYERPYLIVQRGEESTAPEGVDPAAHTPEAVVARMKSDGAYCVKAFYDERNFGGPDKIAVPHLDTMRALVTAGHEAHMPVFVHALSTEGQEIALEAGVDIIAHGLWYWNGETEATELTPRVRKVLDRIIQKRIGWQPTMQVGNGFRDLFDPQYLSNPVLADVLPAALIDWYRTTEGQQFRNQVARSFIPQSVAASDPNTQWEWVRAFYEKSFTPRATTSYMATHGGQLLFGTDTPSSPLYTNPPGLNGRMEMNDLIAAGVSLAKLFRALTIDNARLLRMDDRIGTVEPGKTANLLLLRADPLQSVEAYDTIETVFLHGQPMPRATLSARKISGASDSDM
jgi:imidazolonepropionase-like amidohydrolase